MTLFDSRYFILTQAMRQATTFHQRMWLSPIQPGHLQSSIPGEQVTCNLEYIRPTKNKEDKVNHIALRIIEADANDGGSRKLEMVPIGGDKIGVRESSVFIISVVQS